MFLSDLKQLKYFKKVTEDHNIIFNDESKFGIFQCSEVLDGSFNYTRAPKQLVVKEDCVIRIGAFNSLFRFVFTTEFTSHFISCCTLNKLIVCIETYLK